MALYIVDATIVIHYLIADVYTANAKAFFNAVTTQDELIVPEFCLMECTNVLWKQVRFHGTNPIDAENIFRDLYRLPLSRRPAKRVLYKALQIGLRNNLAVYDSTYIALALQIQAPLLTVDQAQTRAAIAEGVTLIPITKFTT